MKKGKKHTKRQEEGVSRLSKKGYGSKEEELKRFV